MKQTLMKVGLRFPPEKTNKPVVALLVSYGLTFNILKASVSPGKTGKIILELTGSEEDIKRGIEFLKREGITVKVFTDSVMRYQEKCIHCGACTSVCPSGALSMDPDTWELKFDLDMCMLCGHCVSACPARAIRNFEDEF
jgi:L-aspartate semialdehyde sulfurtransferase ferredoxin